MLDHLTKANGKWRSLCESWEKQYQAFGEDFESYAASPFPAVEGLAESDLTGGRPAGIFGLRNEEGGYEAFCQLNATPLPGYTGRVLRARMITISPEHDFGEKTVQEYASVMGDLFFGVFDVSDNLMASDHIKFHLPSPADVRFFSVLGSIAAKNGMFASIETRGAWLYITK